MTGDDGYENREGRGRSEETIRVQTQSEMEDMHRCDGG